MNPIKNFSIERAAEIYRDYANNFLTVQAFAEHHGFTREEALKLIALGGEAHNQSF